MFLVDLEQSGNCHRRLDAHPSRVMIAGSLARTTRLDIVFRDPGSVGENYYLMVLHASLALAYYNSTLYKGYGSILKHQKMGQLWNGIVAKVNFQR